MKDRDYSPPKRERILEWQAQQDFPIIPNPEDPDSGNVYRELRFPDGIYEHIEEFWEEKAESEEAAQAGNGPSRAKARKSSRAARQPARGAGNAAKSGRSSGAGSAKRSAPAGKTRTAGGRR